MWLLKYKEGRSLLVVESWRFLEFVGSIWIASELLNSKVFYKQPEKVFLLNSPPGRSFNWQTPSKRNLLLIIINYLLQVYQHGSKSAHLQPCRRRRARLNKPGQCNFIILTSYNHQSWNMEVTSKEDVSSLLPARQHTGKAVTVQLLISKNSKAHTLNLFHKVMCLLHA